MSGAVSHPQHAAVRPEWLASCQEDALDAAQPIVDAHMHLYDRPNARYLLDDLLQDVAIGHDIRASVFVQARAMLRADGPDAMKPIGETEFANGVAAMSASGLYGPARLCAAIIGAADLMLGDAVRPVLEAHSAVAPRRFRGIRHTLAWDPDPTLLNPAYSVTEDLMSTPVFRAGFSHLAALGLGFDAWLLFHQLPRLADLARAFPDLPIAVDHCGGILGIGPYAGKQDDVFRTWSMGLRELAACPNVMIKVGGLGMRMCGFGLDASDRPASSSQLAIAWRPWVETVIEIFGAHRCMFESNFPVDKGSCSYAVVWNAFKRLATQASKAEKDDLFWRSAASFYRLESDDLGGLSV